MKKITLSFISEKLREGAEFLDSLTELEKKLTDFLHKAKEEIESELTTHTDKNNHQE